MPQKHLTIVPCKKAKSLLPKILRDDSACYFLSDDYPAFEDLQRRFSSRRLEIKNLSGLFDATFQELKKPFLEVTASLNKKFDSIEWWSGQLASRNPAATPLLLNLTYLFCARKILAESHEKLVFIVQSRSLADQIAALARETGYAVRDCRRWADRHLARPAYWLRYLARIAFFLAKSFRNRRVAFKIFEPLPPKKTAGKKRVLIRSWVTQDTFDGNGRFHNRNFGSLPQWLKTRNYEVWNLPLFFNTSQKIEEIFALMKGQDEPFLIPDRYLKIQDYFQALRSACRFLKIPIARIEISGIEVGALFREALKKEGFGVEFMTQNLIFFLLKRLRESGYEFDGFYYPFEGNSPEKPFLLACRTHFPTARIVGFQHTTFFPNQLAYHLGPGESDYHPLPDRLVCSGPIYIKSLRGAGFPAKVLTPGPNLRFKDVYYGENLSDNVTANREREKMLLIPLPGMPVPVHAFELLRKVGTALSGLEGFRLYLRNHPVLPREVVSSFLDRLGIRDYRYADDGMIQDWLEKAYAVFTIGTSITSLESASMGVPVIRIVPDNTFHFDPLVWPGYPLPPAHSPSEIKRRIHDIDRLLSQDEGLFRRIGKKLLPEYFAKPTDKNMEVFL